MLRSSSNRSTQRIGSELTNSSASSRHRRSMTNLFKSYRSTKKQLSLTLNQAEFEFCQAPNENEMIEFMPSLNTEGSSSADPSESTIVDDTITDHQQQSQSIFNNPLPTDHRHCLMYQIKHRLAPQKYESTKRNTKEQDKYRGFLLIDQVDADLVLITDQQHTRHAEACEHGQLDEDSANTNQVQALSTTPVTPSLLPPHQSLLPSSILPVDNHSNRELDVQATQAGIECGTAVYEESNVQDTQHSATNTSSSTNSSNNDSQLTTIDRSTLNDADYVGEQKRDLERLTIYEIVLNNDRRDYQQDLPQNENDELDFNLRYKDAIQLNLKLKEELKRLEDEKARVYSPWPCEVCTFINKPYAETRKDVCEMCEGPSPLKRHTLTS